VLPPDTYDWFEWATIYNTNLSAPFSVGGRAALGQFYNGHHASLSANFTARPNQKFQTQIRLSYEKVHLVQGDFVRRLVGVRLAYAFTPSIFLQSLIQYNNQAHSLAANIRFGWLGPAGTGLFLVFNEGRQTGSDARALDRALILKFTRQLDLGN